MTNLDFVLAVVFVIIFAMLVGAAVLYLRGDKSGDGRVRPNSGGPGNTPPPPEQDR